MKSLQKLALASAIALTSAGAFAMQAMDDESMSAATGQDGITMKIALPCYNAVADSCLPSAAHGLSIDQVFVKDGDGFSIDYATGVVKTAPGGGTYTDYTNAGFILIKGVSVTTTSGQPIKVLIDQVGHTSNTGAAATTDKPFLNVNVTVPKITVALGETWVTNGSDSGAATYSEVKVSNSMSISTSGDTVLNIQLGNQPQGALVKVATTIANGLVLNNVGIHDGGATYGGDINTGSITVKDHAGTDLTINAAVNVSSTAAPWVAYAPNGALIIKLTQLGAAGVPNVGGGGGIDVTLANTTVGGVGAVALGDVILKGVNLNGTRLFVYGH